MEIIYRERESERERLRERERESTSENYIRANRVYDNVLNKLHGQKQFLFIKSKTVKKSNL
jgi:hypothetical protein